MELIQEHELAVTEIAKLRFKLNFGSPFCFHCEGLRAGPDVLATCAQMQQCYFKNLKKGEEDPKHQRLLANLLARPAR